MINVFVNIGKAMRIYDLARRILNFLIGDDKTLPGWAPIVCLLGGALYMLVPWVMRMTQPVDAYKVYTLGYMMNRDMLKDDSKAIRSTPTSRPGVAQIMLLKANSKEIFLSFGEKHKRGEVSCLWMDSPLQLDTKKTIPEIDDEWPQLKCWGLSPDTGSIHVLLTEGEFPQDAKTRELSSLESAPLIVKNDNGKLQMVKDELLVGTARDLILANLWNLGSLSLAAGFLGFSLLDFILWLKKKSGAESGPRIILSD
jgi:hypothetical protein